MATRFYLPSTGAAAVSPAYGGWDDTSGASRRKMVTTKISSAMTGTGFNTSAGSAGTKYLWRQYVSDPIPAKTITGTVKGQLRVGETDALDNHDRVTILLKVVSNDGSTVRGTLLALNYYANTNEYSVISTYTNRKMTLGDSVSSVAAQANDRIVLEVGSQNSADEASFDNAVQAIFGDDNGSDLPEDETTTTAYNPWFEFSADLFTFVETPSVVVGAGVVLGPEVTVGVSVVVGAGVVLGAGVGVGVAVVVGAGVVFGPEVTATVAVAVGLASVGVPTTAKATPSPAGTHAVRVTGSGMAVMALRPTTPASLGDLSRNSYEDTGHIIGPGSGTINLFATVVSDPTSTKGAIDHIKVYAFVGTDDTVPAPNAYVKATAQQVIIKLSGGSRTPYGLAVGSVPDNPGENAERWESSAISTKPGGGAWTWADLANLVELGITADYVLGTNEYTTLRLQEVWVEVHSKVGSLVPPLALTFNAGNVALRLTAGQDVTL